MKLLLLPLLVIIGGGCARTDIYYPFAGDGKSVVGGGRAVVLNGTDSLGHTEVEVTSGGVRYLAAGGVDNSTSTKEGYRTARYGAAAAAWTAGAAVVASQAASAYGANQAAASSSNVAASRSAAAVAASKNATTVRLAEIAAQKEAAAAAANAATNAASKALPAAGSTINAVTPATVVPVP